MAVNKGAVEPERVSVRGLPGGPWLLVSFVVGLLLVFVGQRVVVTLDGLSLAFSLLGAALVVFSTLLRLPAALSGPPARAAVERLLLGLSLFGVLGLALYFATTRGGLSLFGFDGLERTTLERTQSIATVAWSVLIWLSAVGLLFTEAALLPMRGAARLEVRRVRAAALSGLSLSLAAAYCGLFVYSAGHTGAQADYSYFKTSEPGDSTRKVVTSMTETLKVTAFFPAVSEVRGAVDGYLSTLLEGAEASEYRVVDRYLEPKLAEKNHVFSDGVVVFEHGDDRQSLNIGADMKAARGKLRTLDRDVQQSLLKLVRARRVAYLTVGHGELNASGARPGAGARTADLVQNMLRKQNYQVRRFGPGQGSLHEVPSDAEIVLVLGPTEPFAPEEIEVLRQYANGGGRLLLALDADALGAGAGQDVLAAPAAQMEHLSQLAGLVGLTYNRRLLVNERQHMRRRADLSDRALLVTNRFSSHASVSTLSRNSNRAAVIVGRSGYLETPPKGEARVDKAVRAAGGTFFDLNQNYAFDPASEKKGDYTLAAAVSRTLPKPAGAKAEDEAPEMRAFVLADADCLSDLMLANFAPNRLLAIDALRWLGGEESYVGEVVSEEDVRIEHTKQKDLVWFYATLFGAPGLVLLAGLAIARRRRGASPEEG